jgi:hypothetical protein
VRDILSDECITTDHPICPLVRATRPAKPYDKYPMLRSPRSGAARSSLSVESLRPSSCPEDVPLPKRSCNVEKFAFFEFRVQ